MKKRLLLLILALVVLIGGSSLAYHLLSDQTQTPVVNMRDSETGFLDFAAEDQDGNPTRLSDVITGRPAVVYFWATWCRFCTMGLEELLTLYDIEGERVQFLGLNASHLGLAHGEADAGRAYWVEHGFPFPTLYDVYAEAVQVYDVTGIPFALFIDSGGNIAHRQIGFQNAAAMAELIAELE
ncbi:MAG: TlpA family protein disulfide reductase [Oscillospiraceae bacterium]|nr:TlpA family protein disulfide reductase [Oscillospiraceae bacterium]